MNIQTYLKESGASQLEFARSLGLTQGVVSQWICGLRPIPPKQCVAIEKATKGKVTRKDLRPSDWAEHWPELKKSSK